MEFMGSPVQARSEWIAARLVECRLRRLQVKSPWVQTAFEVHTSENLPDIGTKGLV